MFETENESNGSNNIDNYENKTIKENKNEICYENRINDMITETEKIYENEKNEVLKHEKHQQRDIEIEIQKNEVKDTTNFNQLISIDDWTCQDIKGKNQMILDDKNLEEIFLTGELSRIENEIKNNKKKQQKSGTQHVDSSTIIADINTENSYLGKGKILLIDARKKIPDKGSKSEMNGSSSISYLFPPPRHHVSTALSRTEMTEIPGGVRHYIKNENRKSSDHGCGNYKEKVDEDEGREGKEEKEGKNGVEEGKEEKEEKKRKNQEVEVGMEIKEGRDIAVRGKMCVKLKKMKRKEEEEEEGNDDNNKNNNGNKKEKENGRGDEKDEDKKEYDDDDDDDDNDNDSDDDDHNGDDDNKKNDLYNGRNVNKNYCEAHTKKVEKEVNSTNQKDEKTEILILKNDLNIEKKKTFENQVCQNLRNKNSDIKCEKLIQKGYLSQSMNKKIYEKNVLRSIELSKEYSAASNASSSSFLPSFTSSSSSYSSSSFPFPSSSSSSSFPSSSTSSFCASDYGKKVRQRLKEKRKSQGRWILLPEEKKGKGEEEGRNIEKEIEEERERKRVEERSEREKEKHRDKRNDQRNDEKNNFQNKYGSDRKEGERGRERKVETLCSISSQQIERVKSWFLSLGLCVLDGEGGHYTLPLSSSTSKLSSNSNSSLISTCASNNVVCSVSTNDSILRPSLFLYQDRLRNGEMLCDLLLLLEHSSASHLNFSGEN